MKKRIVCLLGGLLFAMTALAHVMDSLYYYLESTTMTKLGQEPPRTYYIPQTAVSLNGVWKFKYYNVPDDLPRNCYEVELDETGFSEIQVPANWEMQGFGDPKFRNMALAFKPNPPFVPKEYNPTGCYRKSFVLPSDWMNQPVFLRMDKVASVAFIWINGHFVGYNQGAHEPAEYRITRYLKPGKNQITVVVVKYSAGYYLEDQDYWRLAGIFDDVTIYTTPEERIADWQIVTSFDSSYVDAMLRVAVRVNEYGQHDSRPLYLRATLYDAENNMVSQTCSEPFVVAADSSRMVLLQQMIKRPFKWTAETPYLYKLGLELLDEGQQVRNEVSQIMGFKQTAIENGVFYLNGQPVKLNAVNSHMQHPTMGHYVDEATIRKDMEILKQFNFNAVRTSHYPPTNLYLKLANEYGLYIIDEAGTEAHATEYLSNDTAYSKMYRERIRTMVLRDRNYPCVLFWSAGNESGEGVNIAYAIEEGKKYDTTRYWMYGGNAYAHPAEDIIGPRYPFPLEHEVQVGTPNSFMCSADNRPSFLDEYLSVAGNGGGAMDEYWENFYKHPRMMGGAIWDFVSPGLEDSVKALHDASPNRVMAHIMGNATIVNKDKKDCIYLNGHDQWVEVYQDKALEITSDALSIYCSLMPCRLENANNFFVTKGNNQLGVQQNKDSLLFYIYTDKRYQLSLELPDNWYGQWHEMLLTYNQGYMSINLDDTCFAQRYVGNGHILNFPYPVNIGRNAEVEGQEMTGYLCNAFLDKVLLADTCLSMAEARSQTADQKAVISLDFDGYRNDGLFYSNGIGSRTYGCIWPDRTVQPEMWQFKYTTQPIQCELYALNERKVRVWNRNAFLNANAYNHEWTIEVNGEKVANGSFQLDIQPLHDSIVVIPYKIPKFAAKKNDDIRLFVTSTLKDSTLWAPEGFQVACSQMDLHVINHQTLTAGNGKELTDRNLTVSDSSLTVRNADFSYSWDLHSGTMASMKVAGKELLQKGPEMNVWRAPLANQLDDWNAQTAKSVNWKHGQGWRMVAEFYSTGIDRLLPVLPVQVHYYLADGVLHILVRDIRLCYGSGKKQQQDLYVEGIAINGFINDYHYKVFASGEILVEHKISTQGKMPLFLPRLGLQMELVKDINHVEWYGRGPQENYPDRKTGYRVSRYKDKVEDMFEPYLIPQDCALRTDNKWVNITDEKGIGLRFEGERLFNFNAYPYTTDNLSRALYTFQLLPFDGITFNLDYQTSGVGCTCRGIFNDYKVYPTGDTYRLKIVPLYGKKK